MYKKNKKNKIKNSKYDVLPWYTAEEKSAFVAIDRDQENKDITTFQKNGDVLLFEKVYKARIPTLQIWAGRYYYLTDSKEDMFGELSLCFTKAVLTYKKKMGAFNTWLFRLLINCVQNIQTGKRAKKRLPEGMDPNSMSKFILSLDYSYDKDGSDNTLKDVLSNKMSVEDNTTEKIINNESIDIMAYRDPLIKGFLKRLSDGNTVASLLKKYKTKKGKIRINRNQFRRLSSKRKQKHVVSNLIKSNTPIQDDFTVLDYNVTNPNRLYYTIEMKKTKEADYITKTIRKIKKDKDNILARISA